MFSLLERRHLFSVIFFARCTVPILWDKILHTIVNNDALDITRIFNFAFNGLLPENKAALDFYPAHISPEIDDFSEWADGVIIGEGDVAAYMGTLDADAQISTDRRCSQGRISNDVRGIPLRCRSPLRSLGPGGAYAQGQDVFDW